MQKNVNIAALILGYSATKSFYALTKYLRESSVDCFIHIDQKAHQEDFIPYEAGSGKIQFLTARKSIFWRGFSMIEAMIELLKAAQRTGPYDMFMFLSDNSMPLLSRENLHRKMSAEVDYISARIARDNFELRYRNFYMLDCEPTQIRWIPSAERKFTPEILARFERLGRVYATGKKPLQSVFHGSQWMALTRTSVTRILESWENDIWLRESFEFSEVPDESYFHTIICSDMKPIWRPFMHVDWSGPRPPRTYTSISELRELPSWDTLFVRKVELSEGTELEWIDSLLQ
jgi:hypothetical protein